MTALAASIGLCAIVVALMLGLAVTERAARDRAKRGT